MIDCKLNKKIRIVLDRLERRSRYEVRNERKIPHEERMNAITHNTGIFYDFILKTCNAKNILEIGTSAGYSTLWFADALLGKNHGHVTTIEKNKKKIDLAKKNFIDACVSDIITIKKGDAKKVLREMLIKFKKNPDRRYFDFVFIDADKKHYSEYFELCFPMVKKGGIIAADNILLPRRFSKHMKKYLNKVKSNESILSTTINIGKGEEISMKIS